MTVGDKANYCNNRGNLRIKIPHRHFSNFSISLDVLMPSVLRLHIYLYEDVINVHLNVTDFAHMVAHICIK